MDPTTLMTAAIDSATKVANTPLFTTIIDKVTGFKISEWAAEGEIRKKAIHDEYEKAKNNGIMGIQYIQALRSTTNLINIAVKSSNYIDKGKVNNIDIDNDFFWNTIEHAKTISNEEMQELIAKIIAGEYNSPGKYEMSTLYTVKMLGKNDLKLFEEMCSLLIDREQIPHDLFDLPESAKDFLNDLKIDYGSLLLLQNLGLFLPNSMTSGFETQKESNYILRYFDKRMKFAPENENLQNTELPSYYCLSRTGEQILDHIEPKFNEKYYERLKNNYKISGYKLVEVSI